MEKQDKSEVKMTKSLIKELNLEGLPEDEQNKILEKIGEIVLKEMFVKTVDSLDEDGRKHFEKMLKEKSTPEEIEEFLKLKISNYEEILQDIMNNLKDDLNKIDKK